MRRLSYHRQSHCELVQQVRFEGAVQLLRDPTVKGVDVAFALGYEDPSHFARAVRRMAGISPREFRLGLSVR